MVKHLEVAVEEEIAIIEIEIEIIDTAAATTTTDEVAAAVTIMDDIEETGTHTRITAPVGIGNK